MFAQDLWEVCDLIRMWIAEVLTVDLVLPGWPPVSDSDAARPVAWNLY